MNEHSIQNAIRLRLSELGYCVFRANVGRFQTKDGRWFDTGLPRGFSDLFAVKDGKIYFLEVKSETGKPSAEQLSFLAVMRDRYGCVAEIVRSVDDAIRAVKLIVGKMADAIIEANQGTVMTDVEAESAEADAEEA